MSKLFPFVILEKVFEFLAYILLIISGIISYFA